MLVKPAPNVVSVFPPGEWDRLFEQLSRYQVPRYQYVMIAALATALAISDVDVDVDVDEKMVQACLVPRDVDAQEHDGLAHGGELARDELAHGDVHSHDVLARG